MFFGTWAALGRVLVIGPLAYVALVLLLRVSGKRTLTKLNAFDLVVTVSLGSTLASVLISKSVSLAEGVLALALLVALQFVITWTSVRSDRVQRLVKAEPTLLLHRGRFLDGAMRAQRVTHADLLPVLRASGNCAFTSSAQRAPVSRLNWPEPSNHLRCVPAPTTDSLRPLRWLEQLDCW